ncbi:MAG: dethiobiotin synthase [Thiobacillaceae bacterium]
MSGFFITGTDTGVGKTLISAALIHKMVSQGLRIAAMKPVATGCKWRGGTLQSPDVELLMKEVNVRAPHDWVSPYAFELPIAPHIAAAQHKTYISFTHIADCLQRLRNMSDLVIVEGVGGLRVPLNDDQDAADLAVLLRLPVILVVGLRLGCLNHALLTAEAMERRGLKFAGWIGNRIDPTMTHMESNLDTLRKRLRAPCLGVIPLMVPATSDQVAPFLEANSVFQNTVK